MKEKASGLGLKVVALGVLLLGAWILFKVLVGIVGFLFWTVVVILAVVAVGWAFVTLLR